MIKKILGEVEDLPDRAGIMQHYSLSASGPNNRTIQGRLTSRLFVIVLQTSFNTQTPASTQMHLDKHTRSDTRGHTISYVHSGCFTRESGKALLLFLLSQFLKGS